ncbi:MAG TPA: radical SAM/SPASM domain-containing protein [Kiritimatiellia bacterium]|nr:radical SAM/SPASM domain-containing protein [Kiritimatiellia bacterium]HPS07622.1 radical SAM/SPASM domain-containing protein [Kiritimatiellia bacterium]
MKALPLPVRMLLEVPPRLLWKFAVGAGLGNLRAIRRFERDKRQGTVFPPFVFVSVTQRCNLVCKGCWATGVPQPVDMSPELLHAIVAESRTQGCRFFGILGGEPLLLPWLMDFFDAHRDSYFQLFTNGQLLDDGIARRLRRAGNVSPLISIEGGQDAYAARRGDEKAYGAALEALASCRRNGLIAGVATSVSASTFADVVTPAFLDGMVARGAHYVWYYIYRPSGPQPCFEEALDDERVKRLRRFLLAQRRRCASAVIIDAYWDHEGEALCPAATGISHHINARGEVEPCPPVQCSDCRVSVEQGVVTPVTQSPFLAAFRGTVPGVTRGCVLMDHPAALSALARRCGAWDSSGRGEFFDELAARPALGCHNHGGEPMPETTWAYRFAKKHWFFGFGAYG